jgi:hypothetical protein
MEIKVGVAITAPATDKAGGVITSRTKQLLHRTPGAEK